jgi:hypothetical protein
VLADATCFALESPSRGGIRIDTVVPQFRHPMRARCGGHRQVTGRGAYAACPGHAGKMPAVGIGNEALQPHQRTAEYTRRVPTRGPTLAGGQVDQQGSAAFVDLAAK